MDTATSALGTYTCKELLPSGSTDIQFMVDRSVSAERFFAWRVWRFAPKLRFLVVVACGLSIAELAILTVSTVRILAIPLAADLTGSMRTMATGSLLGVTADLLITTMLIVTLFRSRTGFKRTDSKIHTVIMYTINTGLLTGLGNLFFVIFAYTIPDTLYPVAAAFIGFKMYATTLLAALNVRQSTVCRCGITTPSVNLVFGSSGGDQAPTHTGVTSGVSGTRVGPRQWDVSGQLEASHDETAVLALIAKSNEEELSDLPLAPVQQRSHIHSW
ncbi:hypothetical protein ONZ51_g10891 [Trametes cubensis]|uniref:DUF6534 domain-containing protein n=1 Tax=Trametes cubensis TaxID=1111947 RepID=A0AAD7TIK3_9APHY|nr:hypothetical protein ONZ51_g10891 [Trametes cubensis]